MFAQLRSATRGLLKWRGGLIVAVLTLAIGIGTTTGLYALVRVMLAELPGVPELDRVGRIYATSPELRVDRGRIALGEFDSPLSKAASFQAIGAYADEDAVVGSGPDARPVIAGYASPAFFTAMGVPPAAGRVFTAADLNGPPVVVVSQALWRRHFPDGRLEAATLQVDGVERAIVGVMPPEFHYGFVGISADLWIPLGRASVDVPSIVTVFGRLRDGVGWPAAQAELAALGRGRGQWIWRAVPIPEDTRTRAIAAYAATLGPALLVLLIACVNVACLLMARGIERERELTVRRALGATRMRIVRVLLTESLVLALVSGTIGGVFAVWILRVIASAFAATQPLVAGRITADLRLLPVPLVTSAAACLLFGTVPALRLSKRDVAASLNGVSAPHRIEIAGYGARDAVVFAEVASAVGFIVWTAMLYTFFAQYNAVTPGFPADHVVAMRVPAATGRDVAVRVAAVPGVARAAVASGMLGGGTREGMGADDGRTIVISRVPVGEGVLETLGIPILRGRSFDADELRRRAGVAVLSESAARQLAPAGNAVGRRMRTSAHGDVVVIGVSRDAIDYGALGAVGGYAPDVYVPYEPPASAREAVVLARLSGDPHAALRAIADAAQAAPGTRPARPIVLSDDFEHRAPGDAMAATKILAAFSMLTLLLAASGVFAVISQSVAQRRRELAVRLAIGATRSRVLGMVLAREAKLIGAAVATGGVFTMLATRALFEELARLSAILPSMWVGALAVSGTVAAAAVALATWKIVRLAPAEVLRRT
jgi:putative ABC transport system permease protein